MQQKLQAGDDLILFPEGTSSDGSRVLPFHSSFFAAAYGEVSPLIQPVSVVYDRLAGLPVGRSSRAVFAWYGDMSLAPHFWQVAQWRGKRVTLLFHGAQPGGLAGGGGWRGHPAPEPPCPAAAGQRARRGGTTGLCLIVIAFRARFTGGPASVAHCSLDPDSLSPARLR
jgi:hypothetical protein